MITINDFDLEKPIIHLLASESIAGSGSKKIVARIRLNKEPISFCAYSGEDIKCATPCLEDAIEEYNCIRLSNKREDYNNEET